eukprot:6156743-Pleurochrysis_carterae.AAC.1
MVSARPASASAAPRRSLPVARAVAVRVSARGCSCTAHDTRFVCRRAPSAPRAGGPASAPPSPPLGSDLGVFASCPPHHAAVASVVQ